MSIAPARPEALLKDAQSLGSHALARPSRDGRPPSILCDGDVLRWRYGERLEDVIEDACRRHAERVAVSLDGLDITYAELDARANQMARLFRELGVAPGDRVAVLLDRGLDAYVTLLGLLKARAAYVPIDANHPAERLAYILEDSRATMAVTHQRFADRFAEDFPVVVLDRARYRIAEQSEAPLDDAERGAGADALCYVLYTSGTTGRPKGVAVAHPSICNFVRVAAESYGFGVGDRVYQGMSIAFDFSVEELWVPLAAGATLVPNAAATSLFGEELAAFLEAGEVTCLCCVPTLLASIERELPKLRVLLIGGEACPPALVRRWSRPGRTLLNSYGPTEATVTATLGSMTPDTAGHHRPAAADLFHRHPRRAASQGIAAWRIRRDRHRRHRRRRGLPEPARTHGSQVHRRFPRPAQQFLRPHLPHRRPRPHQRRRRDRISRPHRHPGEAARLPHRADRDRVGAARTARRLAGGGRRPSSRSPARPSLCFIIPSATAPRPPKSPTMLAHLRARLPAYMTPAYLERLPFIPMLVSNKTDRAQLPKPKSAPVRLAASDAEPETALERLLCDALKSALALDRVSIDGDFFKEYGAHSLLMARFCARIRQLSPLTPVAMRDIYAHTTVRRLAAALSAAKPVVESYAETPAEAPNRLAHALTGAAQLAFYLAAGVAGVAAVQQSFAFTTAAARAPWALLGRAEIVVAAWFLGLNLLAIAAKWALIGRARPRTIRLWSPAYFRFWVARRLITFAPAYLFVGEPLFNLFLRCLGAKIGARAVIATAAVPVAADLFEVGEDAVIARRVMATGYGAVGQRLQFGAVRIGKGGFVGEASVLDHDCALGDFAQLGHASSLQQGQRVPDGKRYHGSPAEETTTNFRLVDELTTPAWRRALFTAGQLVLALGVLGPLADMARDLGADAVGGDGAAAAAWAARWRSTCSASRSRCSSARSPPVSR